MPLPLPLRERESVARAPGWPAWLFRGGDEMETCLRPAANLNVTRQGYKSGHREPRATLQARIYAHFRGSFGRTLSRQIFEGGGNREMMRVHREITERIRIIRRLDFTKAARVDATYDEHARILRAITRRRGDEAQRLLRAHIEQSKLEVRHITLDTLYRLRSR